MLEKLSPLMPKGFSHKDMARILNGMVDKINELEDRLAKFEAEKAFEEEIDESINLIEDDADAKEDVSEVNEEKEVVSDEEEEIIVVTEDKPKKGKKKS